MNSIAFERGTKRTCQDCQARFYDLARTPVVCPKCGADYIEIVRPVSPPRYRGSKAWPGRSPEVEAVADPEAEKSKDDDEEAEEGGERELDGEAEPQEDAEDSEE